METLNEFIESFEIGFLHRIKDYAHLKKDIENNKNFLEEDKKVYLEVLIDDAFPYIRFLSDLFFNVQDKEISYLVRNKIIELLNLLNEFSQDINNNSIKKSESLVDSIAIKFIELREVYFSSL